MTKKHVTLFHSFRVSLVRCGKPYQVRAARSLLAMPSATVRGAIECGEWNGEALGAGATPPRTGLSGLKMARAESFIVDPALGQLSKFVVGLFFFL